MATNKKNTGRIRWFKRVSAFVGLVGTIIGCILGGWSIMSNLQDTRQMFMMVQYHLSTGDNFAINERYDRAINEYKKALEIDENNIEVRRQIIRATGRKLTLKAFPPGDPANDFALRYDYDKFSYVSNSQIDAALAYIYHIRAINPKMKFDVELLLEEALLLKTNGRRANEAIKVLRKANKLAPENPQILAELGLLLAVLSKAPADRAEGINIIRRAIQYQPDEARYHFYLARSLAETYLCPYAGLEYIGAGEAQACAEAIREYHQATDLSTGNDIWSRRISARAPVKSIDIFHRYARKEKDILTPNLSMPLNERIKELEYLLSKDVRCNQVGIEDNPQFWLATLYHEAGKPEKAYLILSDLLKNDHDGWLGKDKRYWEDKYYIDKRLPYFELLVKILKTSGDDPKTLATVQSLLKTHKLDY